MAQAASAKLTVPLLVIKRHLHLALSSGRDGDLEYAITLVAEELICRLDVVQFEAMRDERFEGPAARMPRPP